MISYFSKIFIFIMLLGCNTSVITKFYPEGHLEEQYSLKCGKFVGNYLAYHSNGIPQAIGEYEQDKKVGLWIYFYSDGKLQSLQEFNKGKLININYWSHSGNHLVINGEGIAEMYYDSGSIQSRMTYSNNELHGKFETWHNNGQKATESYYIYGTPSGSWIYWDEQGIEIKQEKYSE